MKFGIGQPAKRVEDVRLLTGRGSFTADSIPDGTLRAAFMRSPYAHARFTLSNLDTVRHMPGVRAVYAATDLEVLGSIQCLWSVDNADGTLTPLKPYPIVAQGEVFHVGDMMAMVVADTPREAQCAVDALEADWQILDCVVSLAEAVKPDAPCVFKGAPGNVAYDNFFGSVEETDEAFAAAASVVQMTVINSRVVANYIEPRAAIASYDASAESFTLRATSQGVHSFKKLIARDILHIAPDDIHVITADVGGGFGTKTLLYREYPLLMEATRRLGAPVAWVATRTEHFLGDAHGRDNHTVAEMALDAHGRFLGMRFDILGNIGGYVSPTGPYVPYVGASMATGPYDIPAIMVRVRGVYTHTSPVDAYRGAGNPEATYVLERLVDRCANRMQMLPERIRALNFVRPEQMPYTTRTGRTYDVGHFDATLEAALRMANRDGFDARRAASAKIGRLRGFGITTYVECTAWGDGETGSIELEPDGNFTILIGTQSTGQGHQTAYAQVASPHLNVPLERIRVIQGDSKRVKTGAGTGGSRSIPVGAVMVDRAASRLAVMLMRFAAELLQTDPAAVEIAEEGVREVSTGRMLNYYDLAGLAAEMDRSLFASDSFAPPDATYPNGTHCCEVEVDPETGEIWIVGYAVADDFGVTLNPMLLAGQIHGGVMQGLGQALFECIRYSPDGQLLTRNLATYALPRARHAPKFAIETCNVPSATNPLGLKGAGEAGSVAASPAVINAISDAIGSVYGPHELDMPATPFAVFTAIEDTKTRSACN